MLRQLSVQNYALIDQLALVFQPGLNVITGETGAGKSILLGALSLILGQRADSGSLLDKSRKCIIEGEFSTGTKQIEVEQFLNHNGLDASSELLLRREISPEGRSRSFINDTPVTLQQLKELGIILVDLQAQHETLMLMKNSFQLEMLDAYAGISPEVKIYQKSFSDFTLLQKDLEALLEKEADSRSQEDYIKFQFDELQDASLSEDEQSSLEGELQTLSHAGEIRGGLEEICFRLSESDDNIILQMNQLSSKLIHLADLHPGLKELSERFRGTGLELKDIEEECSRELDRVQANPGRLEHIHSRLDIIYRLQKKHRATTIRELLKFQEQLEAQLLSIQSLDDDIELFKKKITGAKTKLMEKALVLSATRKKAIPQLEKKVQNLLKEVGMPEALIRIDVQILPEPGINGIDEVRFLFSANKGLPPGEIGKLASGGELSRLMLALKTAVAKVVSLPCIIFDEIDTGVSGETAFRIGKVMQDLSRDHQLIAITHLPQIASRGESHFFVYKDKSGKKTATRVRKLEGDERTVEIARMLSGDKPTAVSLENARELLKS